MVLRNCFWLQTAEDWELAAQASHFSSIYHHTLLRTKVQQVAGRAKAVVWGHQWSRLLLSSCSGILWESFWFQSQHLVVRKKEEYRAPEQLPKMPLRQLPFTFCWKVFAPMVGIWMRLRLLLCFTKSAFPECWYLTWTLLIFIIILYFVFSVNDVYMCMWRSEDSISC